MYEQNNVEFMGVLVDRQYTTGQKYAQLVFETAEGIRLSLSRNINMVRSLRLGLTYKVKGPEHTVGQKRYIHEPTATLVSGGKLSLISKHYKILIPVAIGVIVVLSGVGALAYATTHSTDTSSLPVTHKEQPVSKVVPVTVSSQPTSNTASAPSTSTQQQTKTTPAKSTKNSAPISTTTTTPVISDTTVTTPVTNDVTNPPITQDDPVIITPPVDQTDPTSPVTP